MDALELLREWGGWAFGGMMTIVGFRNNRIDERIKLVINPDRITDRLEAIASDVTGIKAEVSQVNGRVTEIGKQVEFLRGKDAAAE